jgi:hypothetical protein
MEKIKEKLGNLPIPDAKDMQDMQKAMETMMPLFKKLDLLQEIMPKFEIQPIKLAGKSYIAILFPRPPKQEPPKQEDKP